MNYKTGDFVPLTTLLYPGAGKYLGVEYQHETNLLASKHLNPTHYGRRSHLKVLQHFIWH